MMIVSDWARLYIIIENAVIFYFFFFRQIPLSKVDGPWWNTERDVIISNLGLVLFFIWFKWFLYDE